MSFFKVDRKDEGKLYIMKMQFRDQEEYIYKIGVTINDPIDRMLQIFRSHFMIYRYTPDASIKRFKTTTSVYSKETAMHKYFKEQQHAFEKPFDGSTEFFKVDEAILLQVYKDCLEGTKINDKDYKVVLED